MAILPVNLTAANLSAIKTPRQISADEDLAAGITRYNVGSLIFPNDLGTATRGTDENSNTFFVQFTPLVFTTSKFQPNQNASVFNTQGGLVTPRAISPSEINAGLPNVYTNKYVSSSTDMIFYMPDSIKANYSMDIKTVDTGVIGYATNEFLTENDLVDVADNLLGKLPIDVLSSFAALLTGINGVNARDQYIAKSRAESVNPFSEQLFKNVKFRNFNFNFKLIPRNEKEAATIRSMINVFKFHMHPEIDANQLFFQFPSFFIITYNKMASSGAATINTNLNRIASCYLEDMDVDYTGSGQFSAFRDGHAGHINLTLKFRETILLTKEKLIEGVNRAGSENSYVF